MNVDKLELENILAFHDVNQLFLGRDVVGTKYLCLLYNSDKYDHRYVAIRISDERLEAFLKKEVDLRSLFIDPEISNDYYIVSYYDFCYHWGKYIHEGDLPEDMLPDEGYFFEGLYYEEKE